MSHDIELVIFDMDGLMFDTENITYQSLVRAAEKYGYKIGEDLYKLTIGVNLLKTKGILMNHFGEGFPLDEVLDESFSISDEMIDEMGLPIKKGLLELLVYLKLYKVKLAVATSTNRKKATELLLQAKVIAYFDCIVCGDEVEHSKPHPEIFNKVAERLACNPRNTIVLEDSELGIEAAYSAGMLPIMIPDMIQPSEVTKGRLFKEFGDLAQVINEFNRLSLKSK